MKRQMNQLDQRGLLKIRQLLTAWNRCSQLQWEWWMKAASKLIRGSLKMIIFSPATTVTLSQLLCNRSTIQASNNLNSHNELRWWTMASPSSFKLSSQQATVDMVVTVATVATVRCQTTHTTTHFHSKATIFKCKQQRLSGLIMVSVPVNTLTDC